MDKNEFKMSTGINFSNCTDQISITDQNLEIQDLKSYIKEEAESDIKEKVESADDDKLKIQNYDTGSLIFESKYSAPNIEDVFLNEVSSTGAQVKKEINCFEESKCEISSNEDPYLLIVEAKEIVLDDIIKKQIKLEEEYENEETLDVVGGTKLLGCSQCCYVTVQKSQLEAHVKLHNNVMDITVFKCDTCYYETQSKSIFERHNCLNYNRKVKEVKSAKDLTKSYETYSCYHCGVKIKRKGDLTVHMKRKHNFNPKIFKCSECHYEAKRKNDLTKHQIRKHCPNKEIFKCNICNYKTNIKYDLVTHIKRELDKRNSKKFKCDECNFKTHVRSHLKKHVTHKHVKSNLKKHVKYKHEEHLKKFKCSHCEFQTKLEIYLKRHIKDKHNKRATRNLKCRFC